MKNLKLGIHYICDFSGCDRALLLNSERAHGLFAKVVRGAGLTVVDEGLYKFSPHGFTSFLLLAESHAGLHAWPEHGYCAIDLFTCNPKINLKPLIRKLKRLFGAQHVAVRRTERAAQIAEPTPILAGAAA